MCGIAGIFVSDQALLAREDLTRLSNALLHRGPDGEGIWVSDDNKAGLVHRRLAIIDTSDRGSQPMHSVDGVYTIVYNGEIFNYIELRSELEALGSRFRGDSDTEVILEAWRHWGEAMLPRFNGMWALAIRDNLTTEVFLSRDRFGIKPLLYAHEGGRFCFASEMRALRLLPYIEDRLDQAVAKRMLFDAFSIEGSDSTLIRSIKRLPSGHSAWLRNDKLELKRWWRTVDHLVEVPSSSKLRAERFRELFFDATSIRLRSDVSLGTCLSGGFDSSAIACTMAYVGAAANIRPRQADEWRHAFIASFPGLSNDETTEAMEVVRYAGVIPHVLDFSHQDPLSEIDAILGDFDDIYISLPTAPWQIYRELRRAGTLVSLDGHGADELMGGYRQEGKGFGFALRNQVARLAQSSRIVQYTIDSLKLLALSARGLNFLRGHIVRPPSAPILPCDNDTLPSHWGSFNRRLYRMFHGTVLPTILRNFDRLSMAHGVEVRMPFMDWRLVAYVMSLPEEAKYGEGLTKLVARNAMSGYMPEKIRAGRRKVGFNSPMPEWLNGALGSWALGVLSRPDAEFDTLVNRNSLIKKVVSLNNSKRWDWETCGRIWPYIHLKWYMDSMRQTVVQESSPGR